MIVIPAGLASRFLCHAVVQLPSHLEGVPGASHLPKPPGSRSNHQGFPFTLHQKPVQFQRPKTKGLPSHASFAAEAWSLSLAECRSKRGVSGFEPHPAKSRSARVAYQSGRRGDPENFFSVQAHLKGSPVDGSFNHAILLRVDGWPFQSLSSPILPWLGCSLRVSLCYQSYLL